MTLELKTGLVVGVEDASKESWHHWQWLTLFIIMLMAGQGSLLCFCMRCAIDARHWPGYIMYDTVNCPRKILSKVETPPQVIQGVLDGTLQILLS